MTERDRELADECQHPYSEHRIDLKKFADLIRADERKHLEAELLKLKDGVAASSDYIQGRWDLIGEFQDVIRARGKA